MVLYHNQCSTNNLFETGFPRCDNFKFENVPFSFVEERKPIHRTTREGITTPPPPRRRWLGDAGLSQTPLQPLPTPSGPCTQVHPELHSSCWALDESLVHPRSAPEQTGRASGATPQLGDRSRDHTFARTLELSRKGATFCKDKEASLASLTLSSGAERTTLNPLLFPAYCTYSNFSEKLTFHRV